MTTLQQKHFRFSLQISQQQFLRHYQGTASTVQVYSESGQRLQFPASRLRQFLTHSGIYGRFQMTVDANNRLIEIKKLS